MLKCKKVTPPPLILYQDIDHSYIKPATMVVVFQFCKASHLWKSLFSHQKHKVIKVLQDLWHLFETLKKFLYHRMFFFNPPSPPTFGPTIEPWGPPWGSWNCDWQNVAKHFMLGGLDGAEFYETWSNLLLHL